MATRIYLSVLSTCLVACSAICQPVFDFDVEPVIGNKMEYVGTNLLPYTDPGSAGPDQVWDLPYSNSPFANLKQACLSSAGTPFAAQYPGAQYCVQTLITGSPTRFAYYSKTDSSTRFLGQAFLGNIVYKNVPAWEQIYPLNYGAIKFGQFSGTLKIGTQITYYRTHFQQQYDGYGSLNFGGGTPEHDNAMRIKTLLTRIDSLPAANGAHKRTVVTEEFYKWFVNGIPGYVALTSEVNAVQMVISASGDTSQFQQFPTQFSNEWQTKVSVETEEPNVEDVYNLFTIAGNPTHDCLTILPTKLGSQVTEITLVDLDGKSLFTLKAPGNEEKIEIPISSYPTGVYLAVLRTEDCTQVKKWIKH
ncbi:MAG: T9SS type A sorting domain-containing protein [Saprospiraceae bacterium]|nr:T9SS type A sorting domain-containing protein [Saprospiraceae bacterium]